MGSAGVPGAVWESGSAPHWWTLGDTPAKGTGQSLDRRAQEQQVTLHSLRDPQTQRKPTPSCQEAVVGKGRDSGTAPRRVPLVWWKTREVSAGPL